MRTLTAITISVLVSLAFTIAPESPTRTVDVDGRYSMKIPTYLQESFDMNSEASLQYENTTKEIYVIVIDESAEDYVAVFKQLGEYDTSKTTLENYARSQLESIKGSMAEVTYSSPQRILKTGSGNALVYDVQGYQDSISGKLGFTVGFIQGRLNLYMIMTWTFASSQPTYQADMDAMIASFKELSGALASGADGGEKTALDLYSMVVPTGMIQDTSLNAEASFEYANYAQELYILALEEVTTDVVASFKEAGIYNDARSPLENYATVQREDFSSNMHILKELSPLTSKTVNGLETRTFSMRGFDHGVDEQLFYKVRLIQGKTHLYTVMTWTLLSKRAVNEPKMDAMLDSFKEL